MKYLSLLTVAALATSIFTASVSAQTILRSSDTHPDGYPTVEGVKHFGDLFNKATDGRYAVEVFHSSQLGEEKDTIEQTRFGVIDLNRISIGSFGTQVPELTVMQLPFVFRSVDHMHNVVDGEIGDEILSKFEDHGMIGLAYYDGGARSFYNTKHPATTLEDFKGLKFRVQQSDIFIDMVEAIGANATPMPYGEVYSGLETGVLDGAENNLPSYDTAGHFEVAKYFTVNEHLILPEVLVMAKSSWDKLTPEDQTAIRKAAKDSVAKQRELWAAKEVESRKKVEAAGSQFVEVDKQPFIDAMKPVYEKHLKDPQLQDLLTRIQAVQ